MGLTIAAVLSCDRCTQQVPSELVVDKLKPSVDLHLKLPEGWMCNTKADSLELYLICPNCQQTNSLLPSAPSSSVPISSFEEIEVATGPTLRPPPSEKP